MNRSSKENAPAKPNVRKPYETPKVRSYGNIQEITKARDGKKVDSPGSFKTGV
jgi:hypothetical protein